MKRFMLFFVAAAIAVAVGASLFAQAVPEINYDYDANADILNLPSYGEVAGVATNSRGHVFVYARTGHAVATLGDERTFYHGGSRLFQFDQNGKFVKEIGQGVYAVNFAQQVRVDPQDNVWIVDAGSNQVVKFDPDGRLLLVLGRKPESITLRPGPGVPANALDAAFAAAAAGRGAAEAGRGGRGGGGNPGAGPNGDNFNRPSDVTWDKVCGSARSGTGAPRKSRCGNRRKFCFAYFTSTNAMRLTPLQASTRLPWGVAIMCRTTPPPDGMAHVWNFSVFGSNRTNVFGLTADSLYQMMSFATVMP
jgi:hypothetical protein